MEISNKQKIMLYVLIIYTLSALTGYIYKAQFSQGASAAGEQGLVPVPQQSPTAVDITYFIYLILSLGALIFFIKLTPKKFKMFIELYMVLEILIGGVYLTTTYGSLIFLPYVVNILIVVAVIVLIILYVKKKYQLFNLWGILLGIYINSVLGLQLSILTGLILLIGASIFDYIAVIKTKVMGNLVRFYMTDNPLPVMLTTADPRTIVERFNNPAAIKQDEKRNFAIGLGDCVIPAIFMVAAITGGYVVIGIMGIIGGMVGVYANIYLVEKWNKALPALPLIALFEILFAGIAYIL